MEPIDTLSPPASLDDARDERHRLSEEFIAIQQEQTRINLMLKGLPASRHRYEMEQRRGQLAERRSWAETRIAFLRRWGAARRAEEDRSKPAPIFGDRFLTSEFRLISKKMGVIEGIATAAVRFIEDPTDDNRDGLDLVVRESRAKI